MQIRKNLTAALLVWQEHVSLASFVLRDILLALIQYNSHLQVVQVSLGLAWASQEVDGSLIAEEEPGVTLQAKKHKLLSGTV